MSKKLLSSTFRSGLPTPTTRNKVLDYMALRHLTPKAKPGEEPAINVKFNVKHCYTMNAQQWSERGQSQGDVLAPIFIQRWAERTDTLWWSALAHMSVGKRTVRSWAARRLREAFIESLRKQGYAPDGSSLPGTREKLPIVGTAMLGAMKPILKIKNDSVVEQTDSAVKTIIQQQQWFQQNRPGSRSVNSSNHEAAGRYRREPVADVHVERRRPLTIRRT